ncbi:MAG: hypothetical protein ABI950_13035, partial [Solirubrobacteraceae bacterium]
MVRTTAAVLAVLAAVAAVAASGAKAATFPCDRLLGFDPAAFSHPTRIDNTFLPLTPGTRFVLDGQANSNGAPLPHRVTFTVTDLTKVVDGVRAVVVWDVDLTEGQVVESELAFFAQDDAGNVWNVGEYPEEYDQGAFFGASSTWIGGINQAEPGLHMVAHPAVSSSFYLQGYAPDIEFLDCARVSKLNQTTTVPVGTFRGVLVTEEKSPLDPDSGLQVKSHAPGVGIVKIGAVNDPQGETLVLTDRAQLDAPAMDAAREAALALDDHGYDVSNVYRQTPRAESPFP